MDEPPTEVTADQVVEDPAQQCIRHSGIAPVLGAAVLLEQRQRHRIDLKRYALDRTHGLRVLGD